MPKNSPLQKLSPILEDGLIRIGGRIQHSDLATAEKKPTILPKHSHISLLLTRYHHKQLNIKVIQHVGQIGKKG
ncbi:hypothetical protein F2P81_004990 [Scophthalmus maximus]|uniref:Uncharacterized protein n=1 Tax=Scophthalmus maximus TaxID=52904 RepID=A0A6A4TCC0_SCOMX|nr:hypothetical protein F2P81_004990 [Scophthalmus maximus]